MKEKKTFNGFTINQYFLDMTTRKKKGDRDQCPQCGDKAYRRYVTADGHYLPYQVGRCDDCTQRCGYVYSKEDFFAGKPAPEISERFKEPPLW